MKQILKDSLILFAITVVAGILLAFVNELTKEPIAQQQLKQKQEACETVFADASRFELMDFDRSLPSYTNWQNAYAKNDISEIYAAYDSAGNLLGYVVSVINKEGYGGAITIAMGIRLDRTLNAVSILSTNETVGLGLEADKILVPQFTDKNVEEFVYTKNGSTTENEIDAISSATITTNAFVNGVNAGLGYFDMILSKGGMGNE
ncbi:MAG: RnfABCDGE type electron transport complex subunit G [Lachnospiraceae bacterium]